MFPDDEHTKYALSKLSIAHALMRGMGWGSSDAPEPADEPEGVKPTLNAGTSRKKRASSKTGQTATDEA